MLLHLSEASNTIDHPLFLDSLSPLDLRTMISGFSLRLTGYSSLLDSASTLLGLFNTGMPRAQSLDPLPLESALTRASY